MFDCGYHFRILTATVSRLAFASKSAIRPWNPELIDGRHSWYAALHSTICELDMRRLVWTTDCYSRMVSLQKRAVETGVTRIRQQDYLDLAFYKSGCRISQPLRLYVRATLRGHMALLTVGRTWSESMTRTAISAETTS
jgi:hypothetical protein